MDTRKYSKEMRQRVEVVLKQIEKEVQNNGGNIGTAGTTAAQGTSEIVRRVTPATAQILGETDNCNKYDETNIDLPQICFCHI